MSIQTQLDRIKGNITNAYTAAQTKGAAVPSLKNSANLSSTINSIPKMPEISTPADPLEVYRATRPADWLEMPQPNVDEMYLLFHIPEGSSSLLAFTVTCTGDYTVALGTVTNGLFVQSAQPSVSLSSGSKFETELSASNFGNRTSDGMMQVMIKITGLNILTWEPSVHSIKSTPANFSNWNIVDMCCRLPNATSVKPGNSTANRSLKKLRYFSWPHENASGSMSGMFRNCYSLIAVTNLDTSEAYSMDYLFYNCYSLIAIPELASQYATNICYMFYNCNSLKALPKLTMPNASNINFLFYNCYSLIATPSLDTSMASFMSNCFYNCQSLTSIQNLDTTSMSNAINIFNNCHNLNKVTFNPNASGWAGYNLSLADASMPHSSIVSLLNSLPTITSSKTLTLTGNPGVSELTDAEIAIATNKNWTLTL